MTKTYQIPIISRGRVIEPGADAIEFKGRGGATFLAPDPHKHIADLALGNPVLLRDLHDTKISDIVDFLVEVGKRLRLEDNPHMQDSFDIGLAAGGLTEPILRGVFDGVPAMFERDGLMELAESTIGIDYLDGWVPIHGGSRMRAVGTRQLHITAGNVPITAALTIIRAALTKSDCLIKTPSNDPLTANAIARTLIDVDPDHPVTKHVAVAYWKGGDEHMESQIVRTTRIDKIIAWGGMASVKHIQKFLVPGIDLTALNPKFSISVIGRETLESEAMMDEAAAGVALHSGLFNQNACANTRVVYVESDTDDASLEKVIAFGRRITAAYKSLPPVLSTPAPKPNQELQEEMQTAAMEDDFYFVDGDTIDGGVVVSRFSERVDFYDKLNNRVVNLVPMPNILDIVKWCDDTTQSVGVYPESLRDRIVDPLALAGCQVFQSLGGSRDPMQLLSDIRRPPSGLPHDGIEPMRRVVRWVVDHRAPAQAAEPVPARVAAE
jgi:hypothetical protein